MPTVKIIELLCGLAFVSGRFVPLATILISPIIVNIVIVHAFMAPEGLPVALFLVFANSFLTYIHRDTYKPLLKCSNPCHQIFAHLQMQRVQLLFGSRRCHAPPRESARARSESALWVSHQPSAYS